jgi:hypothetical protein
MIFNDILLVGQQGCSSYYCERPGLCHPAQDIIMQGMQGGLHSEYMWSCYEASVNDPGCLDCTDYQEENDRSLANHDAPMNDHDDGFSIDSR